MPEKLQGVDAQQKLSSEDRAQIAADLAADAEAERKAEAVRARTREHSADSETRRPAE